MLKTVIVDDEEKAIQSLSWELSNFSEDVEILQTFTSPKEGLEFVKNNTIDCLFLDIEMPMMDGFQFLEQIEKRNFAVVITTAYGEYGIKALKNNAQDYLLKPVDGDDLEKTIDKVKKYHFERVNVDSTEKFEEILHTFNDKFNSKKIAISVDGKIIFLNYSDLIFVESDGNYSSIYLTDGKKIVVTKKLKEVNDLLPKDYFFRIHNSYIINLEKIKEFYKTDGYVILEGNHKIPVSRQRRTEFLDKF